MNRLILAFSALALAAGALAGPATAEGRKPTMLIMAEDGDSDSIPRRSRISTRILNELATRLDLKGFDVYDETALTVHTHAQGRSHRSDAELVDIAKSIQNPPIDVVVFFEVHATVARKTYQNEVRLRTVGRLLNVADGRLLGNWEAKLPDNPDQVWLLPNRCFPDGRAVSRDCLLEAVGDDARILAQEVGTIIGEKLETHLATTAAIASNEEGLKRGFSLVFDGFTSTDLQDIEEYLVVFSGYVGHRPTRSEHLHHELWYESTISTGKLQRNLHKMMELLEIPYVLKFQGNSYTVRAKDLRGEHRAAGSDRDRKW